MKHVSRLNELCTDVNGHLPSTRRLPNRATGRTRRSPEEHDVGVIYWEYWEGWSLYADCVARYSSGGNAL